MRKKRPKDWSGYKYCEEIDKRQDKITDLEKEIEQLRRWFEEEAND